MTAVAVTLAVVGVVVGLAFDVRNWLASKGDDSTREQAPNQAPTPPHPVPAIPNPAPVFSVTSAPPGVAPPAPVLPAPPPAPSGLSSPALFVPGAPPPPVTVAHPTPSVASPPGGAPLLVCRNVHVAYDKVRVLFGVDMEIRQGEIVALLGTNGAGKSTLLKAVSGLVDPVDGSIVFDGQDITHAEPVDAPGWGSCRCPGAERCSPP